MSPSATYQCRWDSPRCSEDPSFSLGDKGTKQSSNVAVCLCSSGAIRVTPLKCLPTALQVYVLHSYNRTCYIIGYVTLIYNSDVSMVYVNSPVTVDETVFYQESLLACV